MLGRGLALIGAFGFAALVGCYAGNATVAGMDDVASGYELPGVGADARAVASYAEPDRATNPSAMLATYSEEEWPGDCDRCRAGDPADWQ